MNKIQKYVVNSLFVRNQITEEKLIDAIESLGIDSDIDSFLEVLIYGNEEELPSLTNFDDMCKDIEESSNIVQVSPTIPTVIVKDAAIRKIAIVKIMKETFGLGLKEAKDLVDLQLCTDSDFVVPSEFVNPDTIDYVRGVFRREDFDVQIVDK